MKPYSKTDLAITKLQQLQRSHETLAQECADTIKLLK